MTHAKFSVGYAVKMNKAAKNSQKQLRIRLAHDDTV